MQDIEALVTQWIAMDEKDANNEGNNPIIRQAAKARIAIFKIAPRDLPRLKMELDTLERIWRLVNGGQEIDAESARKESEKWRALMSIKD